jgi:hypothetical protein
MLFPITEYVVEVEVIRPDIVFQIWTYLGPDLIRRVYKVKFKSSGEWSESLRKETDQVGAFYYA